MRSRIGISASLAATDAAASQDTPQGGAATGLGGTAPGGPEVAPWLTTLVGGLLLAAAGVSGLRRSRAVTNQA